MTAFVLTRRAKDDMRDIARNTEKRWGREQRNCYLRLLDTQFHALAEYPLLGKDCGFIKEKYRRSPVGRHIIFYRILDTEMIEIVRILHEKMDVEPYLK